VFFSTVDKIQERFAGAPVSISSNLLCIKLHVPLSRIIFKLYYD